MSVLKIEKNKEKIVKLINENIDLQYNLDLKRFSRFSEETRQIGSKKEPKEVKLKIGHWFEWFYDEDYPKDKKRAVKIERSQIIEIDGQKSDHWNKIKYYSISDF
jgi:propanediol dehydratase large subunit